MTKKQERIVFILMTANALLFAVVFLMVGSNYRLAADDLHYLVKTQELGIWDSMMFYYQNWNSRWSATLVTNLCVRIAGASGSTLWFHFATIGLGLLAISSFVFAIAKGLSLRFSKTQLLIIASYLLSAVFYCSFAKSDTWYWMTVVPMYLWACFVAILAGSLVLRNRLPTLRYLLIALGFVYVGGASESAAICSLITLFFLGFITHDKNLTIPFDRTALHVATLACFTGFAICLLGKGIHIRHEHLPKMPLTDRSLVGLWNYVRFNFWQIPKVLPMMVLTVAPFAFFGRRHLTYQLISIREALWTNRKLWAWADLVIMLLAFALAMVMGEMGPTRTWVPLTFVILTVATTIAYSLGTWVYITSRGNLFLLVLVCQLFFIGFQSITGFQQIRKTSAYAWAIDERMEFISVRMNSSDDPIRLSPLPDSGWLFSAEISADTSHFTNRHLKLFFGNTNSFVLKDNVTSSTE